MRPDVWFQIRERDRAAELAIGPGKIALLEAIAETGSISSAARRIGMSYRRAWMLVDETNRCLVEPAVEAAVGGKHGGGTALTSAGLELVRRYRRLEKKTQAAVATELESLMRSIPARGRTARSD